MEWLLAILALAALGSGGAAVHKRRKRKDLELSANAASADIELELRSFVDVGESALNQAKQKGRANHWELLAELSENAGAEIERARHLALDPRAEQLVSRAVKLKARIDKALVRGEREPEARVVERVVYIPAPPAQKPSERPREYE